MPIRINLLAEQQAAEEMRRKDPVKRSIYAAIALVVLTILYSVNFQFKLMTARGEVSARETRYRDMESDYSAATGDIVERGEIQENLAALERHRTNRFLWTRPLNALQHAMVPNVRMVRLNGSIAIGKQEAAALVNQKTLRIELPKRSWWQWWTEPPGTNINELATKEIVKALAAPEYVPYLSILQTNWAAGTNLKFGFIAGKLSLVKPETRTETIRLTLEGRDYSSAEQYATFYRSLTNDAYFGTFLGRTNSSVQRKSVHKQLDTADPIYPSSAYIPFDIEGTFPDRIRIK